QSQAIIKSEKFLIFSGGCCQDFQLICQCLIINFRVRILQMIVEDPQHRILVQQIFGRIVCGQIFSGTFEQGIQKIQQEKVSLLGCYTSQEISAQFFLVKIFVEAKEGEDCKARPDGVNGCFGAVIHPAGGKDFLYALLPAGIKGQTAAAEGFAVV